MHMTHGAVRVHSYHFHVTVHREVHNVVRIVYIDVLRMNDVSDPSSRFRLSYLVLTPHTERNLYIFFVDLYQ